MESLLQNLQYKKGGVLELRKHLITTTQGLENLHLLSPVFKNVWTLNTVKCLKTTLKASKTVEQDIR